MEKKLKGQTELSMNLSDGREQCSTWWMLMAVFVTAVAFNYLWELAQAPLYAGMGDFSRMLWHCFVPSLGDGLIVLLIFALGWAVLHRRDWFVRPGVYEYALMLIAWLVIAISVELAAVHTLGRWKYTTQMPLLPGLGIGLAPVAQMLLLPPIIFRVVAIWCDPSP
jgi:hypothetical protein